MCTHAPTCGCEQLLVCFPTLRRQATIRTAWPCCSRWQRRCGRCPPLRRPSSWPGREGGSWSCECVCECVCVCVCVCVWHHYSLFLVLRLQAFDGRGGSATNESVGKTNFVEIGCLYAVNQSEHACYAVM